MGKNKHCTPEERRLVLRLKNGGNSLREISRTLNRSLGFVQNALKPQPNRETRGRPTKTQPTIDNRIVTLAPI